MELGSCYEDVEVISTTRDAVCVLIEGSQVWAPRSWFDWEEDPTEGDVVDVYVFEWAERLLEERLEENSSAETKLPGWVDGLL